MKFDRLTSTLHVPVRQESVVDFWESVTRDWPELKYDSALVEDLDALLKKYSRERGFTVKRVLDCGCGTGNPSIGLKLKGYEMFGVDADPGMVARFKENCREVHVDIPVITYDWRDLNDELLNNEPFDAAICRGNSLIYAGCWDRSAFIPKVAANAISTSLRHMSNLLRPGGLLYVDITSADEYRNLKPKVEFVGVRETDTHNVIIYWTTDYVPELRTRHAYGRRLFESKLTHEVEEIRLYTFTSYMLLHDELKQAADAASLELVQEYVPIKSELCYDVFLFKKLG
jgi:SAM-dependent methyltransferase